jgi:hypothetical protein
MRHASDGNAASIPSSGAKVPHFLFDTPKLKQTWIALDSAGDRWSCEKSAEIRHLSPARPGAASPAEIRALLRESSSFNHLV